MATSKAPMIEPMVLATSGDLDGALAGLKRLKASGFERFQAWRDDAGFAPLFELAAYRALFTWEP